MKKCSKKDLLNDFIVNNKNFMNQPIVKSFLSIEENYNFFEEVICNPTKENNLQLDKVFKQFYSKARLIKYMSILIHYSAIEYDKKLRTIQKRFPLTLDQPISSEEDNITILETLSNNNQVTIDDFLEMNYENLTEYFSCSHLISAINKLKPKQKLILKYKYIDNLKNIEIAEKFKDTPQNISKINKKTLKKIKEYIEEGKKKYEQKRSN